MAWKIVFGYSDGSTLKISSNRKKLTTQMAEKYRRLYDRPNNDGGMVYISPYKNCVPVNLSEFIG